MNTLLIVVVRLRLNKWVVEFQYNSTGRGDLTLREGNLVALSLPSRTGSIDVDGDLINPIKSGIWSIRDKSVYTTESGMSWNGLPGRKIRLYTPKGNWSHYLIHPDGGMPGSLGCVVFSDEGTNFFNDIDKILDRQKIICVYINVQIPQEVLDGIA
jgi:hypothetical protein